MTELKELTKELGFEIVYTEEQIADGSTEPFYTKLYSDDNEIEATSDEISLWNILRKREEEIGSLKMRMNEMENFPDVNTQEIVIKKLNLISADAVDYLHVQLEEFAEAFVELWGTAQSGKEKQEWKDRMENLVFKAEQILKDKK